MSGIPYLERSTSFALTGADDTPLARAVDTRAAAHPGTSGVHLLPQPREAFAARVLLMRAAERSLDVQYYIWHADTTGFLLLEEAWKAAERGVRVRLLLDDNGIAGLDATIAALDSHPLIDIRLFNPFVNRRFKTLGYLTEFRRLNRRMHNKSLTADARATIVGGRNVGDVYFGSDPSMVFVDLDVLALGPIARDVRTAFDAYWNSDATSTAASIIGRAPAGGDRALVAKFAAVRESPAASQYLATVRDGLAERIHEGRIGLDWVPVQVVFDPPGKALDKVADEEMLLPRFERIVGRPVRDLDIVSPYFVPGETGTAMLARLSERDVRCRVVTNSLAATDVSAVHAGYAKRRKPLLRAGVSIRELKPTVAARSTTQPLSRSALGSSSSSLHAKTFIIDRRRVFVGSFNLDQRSIHLNTEMGLVIESERLANEMSAALERRQDDDTYEVALATDGNLTWIEHTDRGVLHHRVEPGAGLLKRVGTRLLSWLPIEWLL